MTQSKVAIAVVALVLILMFPPLPWAEGATVPPVNRIVLENRLVLLVSEEHSLPFVIFEMLIDAGSRRDPIDEEGLAHLTAKGLLLGTPRKSERSMNDELDFLGASLTASAGRDYALISLQVLKKDLAQGFDLFMETLTSPLFPEKELKRQAQKTLGDIQAADEQPMRLARRTFLETLFPKSPYGHPVEGTRESVPGLTRDQVARFYKTFYHPNAAFMAIVGDISMEEVKEQLVPLLSKWQAVETEETKFAGSFVEGPKSVAIDRQVAQASIILGHVGVRRDNPDYYPLSVMNYILGGGGFGSRLFDQIRVERGLAYSVGSMADANKYQGSFEIVLQTKNSSAAESIEIVRRQMELIRTTPVSERELSGARSYLTGSFPLRLDSQSKLAGLLVSIEYYGLGLDYFEKYPRLIESVTSEDVLRVAKSYLHPEKAILVVVANLKKAGIEQGEGKK